MKALTTLLNKVVIESTMRICSDSVMSAAIEAVSSDNVSIINAVAVDDEGTFLVEYTFTYGNYTTTDVKIVYVDCIKHGKYRVDVSAAVAIDQHVMDYLIGGDEAVNEGGYYQNKRDGIIVPTFKFKEELAYWVEQDALVGSTRIQDHIRSIYDRVYCVDGEFITA